MTQTTPDAASLTPGQVLNDTYVIERLLGAGGMGAVYAATHRRIPKRFAVKVLKPDLLRDPLLIKRFEREARIGAELGHDHIVQVVDFNKTDDGMQYIVMELLEGRSLSTLIGRPQTAQLAIEVARQVALALAAAHAHGIIHRDIKPDNLFLCPRADGGELVKVLDFGLSKMLSPDSLVSRTHAVSGTPLYMAPEQVMGCPVDGRADLFALGIVLYHLLAGTPPFHGETIMETLAQILNREPRPLLELRPDMPPALARVVERCLRKSPDERYPSAQALLAALDAVRSGSPELAARDELPQASIAETSALGPTLPLVSPPGERASSLPPPRPPAGGLRWAVAGIALLVAGGAVALSTLATRGTGRGRARIDVPAELDRRPASAAKSEEHARPAEARAPKARDAGPEDGTRFDAARPSVVARPRPRRPAASKRAPVTDRAPGPATRPAAPNASPEPRPRKGPGEDVVDEL